MSALPTLFTNEDCGDSCNFFYSDNKQLAIYVSPLIMMIDENSCFLLDIDFSHSLSSGFRQ